MKVFIGHEEKAFIIHRRLVCQASSYFKAALDGDFEESIKGELHLHEQEPELFNCFLEWVYSGEVDLPKLRGEQRHDSEVWMKFSKLYLLSKYLQCPAFGNCLLDTAPLKSKYSPSHYTLPDAGVLKTVYENTLEQCGIRKYFAAVFVWLTDQPISDDTQLPSECLSSLPSGCVLDIANLAVRETQNGYQNMFRQGSKDIMKAFHDESQG